ncbi:MAG: hypothetical protein ACLPWS_20465 [Rhodomicrobium sp.]
MFRKLVSVAAVTILMPASVQAAYLANVDGTVLINRGNGFRPAWGGAEVGPGDRVRVENGAADIVYDNGCAVKLSPGQTMAVLSVPPVCAKESSAASSGLSTESVVIGGLVIGSGVGLAVALTETKAAPASP